MIIKGKSRTFGFWLSVFFILFGILTFFQIQSDSTNTPWKGLVFFYLVLLIGFGAFGRLLYDAHFIDIDIINKTIQFKNRLTFKRTIYHFSDFDGKLICYEPIKWGFVRNVYFIKDKRAVKKLTTFMYSNQAELEEHLQEIKDLGTFEYSYIKTWKISLGLPIMD